MTASVWTPSDGEITVNADNILKRQRIVTSEGQTELELTAFSYVKDTGSTLMFYNGSELTVGEDYEEVDGNTLRLLFPARVGDVITVYGFVGTTATVNSFRVFQNRYVATGGETQITVAAEYVANTSAVMLFKNGELLYPDGVDYSEVSGANIDYVTLTVAAIASDVYYSVVGQVLDPAAGSASDISAEDNVPATLWNTVQQYIDYMQSEDGASQVGYKQGETNTVARSTFSILRERKSITDFMTTAERDAFESGSFTVDHSTAMQNAVNSMGNGGVLLIPYGGLLLNSTVSLIPFAQCDMEGVGGFSGSRIKSPNSVISFTGYAERVGLHGLCFGTSGTPAAGATAFQDLTGNYQVQWVIDNCDFLADLQRCFRGNLVVSTIRNSTFGYYGSVGGVATHHHLRSDGNVTYATNVNKIEKCRFFNARGAGTGVYFENGFGLDISGSNFESSSVQALTLLGILRAEIKDECSFERIAFSSMVGLGTGSLGGSTSRVVVDGNIWNADATTTEFFNCAGAASLDFTNNELVGGAYAGTISNAANAFVLRDYNNNFGGLTGNWDVALHTGNAFKFPATPVPSADPNTLDSYSEQVTGGTPWTPTPNGFATTGSPIYTGNLIKIGRFVKWQVNINPNGGTVASTAGSSYFTGLPYPVTISDFCVAANQATAIGLGSGAVQGGGATRFIYPPTWGATGSTITLSGTYITDA